MALFANNINHSVTHIRTLLDSLKSFETLPNRNELTKKISSINSSKDLNNFVKENALAIQILKL
jgi:hypothetical protein